MSVSASLPPRRLLRRSRNLRILLARMRSNVYQGGPLRSIPELIQNAQDEGADKRDFKAQLLGYINEANEGWVRATRRISPRLLCDLLRLTDEETRRYFESLDLFETGEPVSWAGPDPAPVWLDVAREYTERWHHQQQIRDAVCGPGLKEPRFFAPVLDTFVRALPYTFRDVEAATGTVALIVSGEAGGDWSLVREGRWVLYRGSDSASATVTLDQETAWRLFTKGIGKDEAAEKATLTGDRSLGMRALDTVSIIA